jgi:CubicO group peptidase (beta-lactamase class C family)
MTDTENPLHSSAASTLPGRLRQSWFAKALVASSLAVAFAGLAVGNAAPSPQPSRPPSASLDLAAVDRLIQDGLEASALPGAALAITRGDEVLHVRGYGHDATGAALSGTSLFRVASLSKSMTATAVMQLVEAGRLSLDHSVASYLPEFRPADGRGAAITVSQVLNQTSGLADRTFNELDDPQPANLAEAVSRLRTATLAADPGAQWNYHNPNYEIAARLVEVASGQPFDQYLREHVFLPAGMAATSTTHTDNAPVAGLADGHVTAYGLAIPVGIPDKFGEGAGDVVSSASDMAQWLVVNTNHGRSSDGHRIISSSALNQMHTSSTTVGYGYGWSELRIPGSPRRVVHTGNLLTFSAFQAVLPDSGYGVVLMFNSGSARTLDQADLFEGVIDLVTGTPGTPDGLSLSAATVDLLLAVLTLAVLALGVIGVVRSRQ